MLTCVILPYKTIRILLDDGLVLNDDSAPGRIRTHDPRNRSPVLYPTELRTHILWGE